VKYFLCLKNLITQGFSKKHDMNSKNSFLIQGYYNFTLALTFLTVLLNLLTGYFSVSTSLNEISRDWRLQTNVELIYCWGVALLLIFVCGLLARRMEVKFPWQFYYAYSFSLTTAWFVEKHVSPMLLIGGVFFALIFNFQRAEQFKCWLNVKYIYFLSAWQLAPVFLDKLGFEMLPTFYWTDGFRGIAFDRVEYAFFVGLSILAIIVTERVHGFWFWGFILGLSYCAYLSQTRFVYLAILIAFMVYWGVGKRLGFALILVSLAGIGSLLGSRGEMFDTGRSSLYLDYAKYLQNNLDLLAFGASKFYQSYNDGEIPHNLILQTILNWGLIGLSAWIMMISKCIAWMSRGGKSLLSYLLTFGLFHPGVDAYLITPMVALVFLIAIGASNKKRTASVNRKDFVLGKGTSVSENIPSLAKT
jgi:hypothetical protein